MEIAGANIIENTCLEQLSMPVEPHQLESAAENSSRYRIWMIHDHFKCPIVGICVGLEEQRRILKKTGRSISNCSTYQIHAILVNSLLDENTISIRIDTCLNRKFKHEVSEFFDLDRSLFLKSWETSFEKGEIAGLLWVAATRTDLLAEDIASIFGDIHMEMHLTAERNRKIRQQLFHQQEKNRRIAQKLKEETGIRRTSRKEKEKLEREHAQLRHKYTSLEKAKLDLESNFSELIRNSGMPSLEAKNTELQFELKEVSTKMRTYQERLGALQDQNNRLLSKLDIEHKMNNHLTREKETLLAQISLFNRCDEECPSFDLCRKRILIVGGITKLEAFYRKLVEQNGGSFDYHDGYMNRGTDGLDNQIRRADVVLCPVNCNSHNACSMVKKLSRRHSKPVQMLASSSLNAISQALLEHREGMTTQ